MQRRKYLRNWGDGWIKIRSCLKKELSSLIHVFFFFEESLAKEFSFCKIIVDVGVFKKSYSNQRKKMTFEIFDANLELPTCTLVFLRNEIDFYCL